ncbi:MAG: hypothetical protein JO149_08350 [Gammaproteobacteria bacterium]|nr:hypothetical protein [Gammaproteobacteria bacterium]
MIITYEMLVNEFFNLSTGHIVLVGKIMPDLDKFISTTKADLYIGKEKIKTINILGEDRFSGGNEEKRKGLRVLRTTNDIVNELNAKGDKPIKLVIYIEN